MESESVRQRGPGKSSKKASLQTSGDDFKKSHGQIRNSADASVLLVIGGMLTVIMVTLLLYSSLPVPNMSTTGNKYSTANARRHMEAITDLGIRHVGSIANEVLAKNVILEAVADIQKQAVPEVEIDVSVQMPSGGYYLDFLGGMTHIYHNITNIVVRLRGKNSSNHALMINAHYDSALGAIAASDDAVSCATMLEILRCLSSSSASDLKHSVIFLFNGAEETILQASHGFVTQHPWAQEIQAFINLEAAGAGGKELLFQTGPDHPWLAKMYAKFVPHPFGSVFAQELFQTGIIPSDTDFRIFRDYGKIPGIDLAYFVNGYVYHTKYDIPSSIPDGSIQRAGDNVLALVSEIASSPLLADPGEDKHGKVTFFDVAGLFMVVYPERIGTIINCTTILLSIFVIWFQHRKGGERRGFLMLFKTMLVILVSLVMGLLVPLATALLIQLSGQIMSWYATPLLVVPLYFIPALLGSAVTHRWWGNLHRSLSYKELVSVSLHSILLLWTIILALTTYLRLSSSFIALVWSLPLILFYFIPALLLSHTPTILFIVGLSLPVVLGTNLAACLLDLFVPLTGRSGTAVSPDIAIAVLCAILNHMTLYPLSYLVHSCSKYLYRVLVWGTSVCWLLCVVAVVSGLVFPFSVTDSPRPKRMFLTHTQRTFHTIDGAVQTNDSLLYLFSTDYRGLDTLPQVVPALKDSIESGCTGLYCDAPAFFPMYHMITQFWHIPASPPPVEVSPATVSLVSREDTSSGTQNLTFFAKFPHRAAMIIGPASDHHLVSWSLENYIPPSTNDRGRPNDPTYFIFYARGTGDKGEFTFWIEIKGTNGRVGSPSLSLSVAAHYIDPPLSQSPDLSRLLSAMPDWVTPIAWTCALTKWTF